MHFTAKAYGINKLENKSRGIVFSRCQHCLQTRYSASSLISSKSSRLDNEQIFADGSNKTQGLRLQVSCVARHSNKYALNVTFEALFNLLGNVNRDFKRLTFVPHLKSVVVKRSKKIVIFGFPICQIMQLRRTNQLVPCDENKLIFFVWVEIYLYACKLEQSQNENTFETFAI